MRLVFPAWLIALGVVLIGFQITNPGARVDVTVGNAQYDNAPLSLVAFFALSVGVAFTALVALIEGATIRLDNRRLRREIQRLETENNFMRTQPQPAETAGEPKAALRGARPIEAPAERPASAPVYDPESPL